MNMQRYLINLHKLVWIQKLYDKPRKFFVKLRKIWLSPSSWLDSQVSKEWLAQWVTGRPNLGPICMSIVVHAALDEIAGAFIWQCMEF
jgi:hypothetical protein